MVSYVIKCLESVPLPVKIVSSNLDYLQFGLPVYADSIKGRGPMGGLFTAMEHTSAPYVLLIGCDMPFITKKIICHLIENSKESMITVTETNGKINPLLAIYPKAISSELSLHLGNGKLKMQDFITSQKHHILKMEEFEKSDPKSLTNINSKEELEFWNKL